MWHLFGPIIRWPLHSPLRLLGVIAGAIAVVMVLGAINDRGEPRAQAPATPTAVVTAPADGATEPTPTPSATAGGSATTDGGAGAAGGTDAFSEDPAATDPGVAAQQAAAEFVAAWARPDLDPVTWQAGLAPVTAPELLQTLADTDPANLPAVTVAGPPVEVAANAEAAVFDVPTTGEFVRVHVQLVDGAWLATDVQPTA
jgi:hypothetical protein